MEMVGSFLYKITELVLLKQKLFWYCFSDKSVRIAFRKFVFPGRTELRFTRIWLPRLELNFKFNSKYAGVKPI
ncbi:hypothetical protein BES34_007850 [Leptospira inadai serovar Lyme]|uniref:DUF4283 domain-containing protein n=1 Tax=Leptospira inadai serovar Lyme TaxID=293084 RepID=A0ABX4YK19_9LEPT|nr:hypothetical protein BES34_007850 [Leptospira inadai serovar Lyme]